MVNHCEELSLHEEVLLNIANAKLEVYLALVLANRSDPRILKYVTAEITNGPEEDGIKMGMLDILFESIGKDGVWQN